VAGHEREATLQDAGVLLVVGATQTTGFDAQEPGVVTDRGSGQVVGTQPSGLLQHERPHRLPARGRVARLPASGAGRALLVASGAGRARAQAVTWMEPFMELWMLQW
jgi:hypothetical protein